MSVHLAQIREDINAMRAAVGQESNADLLTRLDSICGRMFSAADTRLSELETARAADSEAVHA